MKGDAAGELDAGDGVWTAELRERYADRIQARIARHIPNLESVDRRSASSLSPADLWSANVNLVRGDPYGGSLALDQNFLWRAPHRTPVKGIWHVGASTHPGPGPRRRLGRARRAAAARAAAHEADRGTLLALIDVLHSSSAAGA